LPRPDANIAPGYGIGNFASNAFRQKFLNLTGVKYILNKDDGLGAKIQADQATFPEKNYKLVWQQAPWQVYENLAVAPRVFLTTDYLVMSDENAVIAKIFSAKFNEKKTIILDEDPKIAKLPLLTSQAKIVDYSPNTVTVTTENNVAAVLFLSDTYSRFWSVTVDGHAASLLKADYAFRAVVVPAGKHTISFFYSAERFTTGLLYSGLFAIVLGLVFIFIKIKKL